MANEGIPINAKIIAWGRQRAGLTSEEASRKFTYFQQWENGDRLPTYPQLEQIAEALKLPLAVFFFPEPPKLPPIRESFRTLPDTDYDQMPREVRFMLRKAKAFQINISELTGGRNPAERFILQDTNFDSQTTANDMAAYVRSYLGITIEKQFRWNDNDVALKSWRKSIQDVGIFVFKDAFKAKEYCGFSLFDHIFPIIYINNSMPKSRQIFTLFHELGHILLHTSGVDKKLGAVSASMNDYQKRIEVLCNRFAGQFLVPDSVFDVEAYHLEHSREAAESLAEKFNVSREVIYRKFLDRGWISQSEYEHASDEWKGQLQKATSSGGDHYNNKISYLGREYIGLALREYYQNRISQEKLADYLDIKIKNISSLEDRYIRGGA